MHAPGPANSAVLFGADGPFAKEARAPATCARLAITARAQSFSRQARASIGELRGVPFATARPTLAEATRVAAALSRADYLDPVRASRLAPATGVPDTRA